MLAFSSLSIPILLEAVLGPLKPSVQPTCLLLLLSKYLLRDGALPFQSTRFVSGSLLRTDTTGAVHGER